MRRTYLVLGLLIILLSIPLTILLLSKVQDLRKGASEETYVLSATKLTDDALVQRDPDVFQDLIFWQSYLTRNGDIVGAQLNLDTFERRPITLPRSDELEMQPKADQGKAVWWGTRKFIVYDSRGEPHERLDEGEVFLWREGSSEMDNLSSHETQQWDPDIWGNLVVWEDWRGGTADIYYLDLAANNPPQPVKPDPNYQHQAAIWGKTVVWHDFTLDKIYFFNLETRQEGFLDHQQSSQRYPDIADNLVVWQDDRNGNWNIYGYNLLTNETLEVYVGLGNQTKPRVSGRYVVWEDDQRGNKDVRGKNLLTGEVFEIANTPKDEVTPAIDGQLVVWEEDPEGVSDIILAKLRPSQSASDTFLQSLAAQFADSSVLLFWTINQSLIQEISSLKISLTTPEGEVVETVNLPTNAATYTFTNLQNGQRYISTLEAVSSIGRVLQSLSVEEVPRCRLEDLNGNGEVDIFDLVLVARRFGADADDTNFDSVVDLDKDGDIDLFDLVRVASAWSQRC